MIIGRMSNAITTEEREKISYLPVGANTYLEIPSAATEPGTGVDGELYYNTTDSKFYMYETGAWVEVLFSMGPITP